MNRVGLGDTDPREARCLGDTDPHAYRGFRRGSLWRDLYIFRVVSSR
jgi:hypothetical protein